MAITEEGYYDQGRSTTRPPLSGALTFLIEKI